MMVLLAVAILTGQGDGLIAGYNTVKEEERNQFNMKRLRAVVAAMVLFTMAYVWIVALIDSTATTLWGLLVLFVVNVAGIRIANTWCKKN